MILEVNGEYLVFDWSRTGLLDEGLDWIHCSFGTCVIYTCHGRPFLYCWTHLISCIWRLIVVPNLVFIDWFGLAWLGWTVLYFAFLRPLLLSVFLVPLFSLACCIFAKFFALLPPSLPTICLALLTSPCNDSLNSRSHLIPPRPTSP